LLTVSVIVGVPLAREPPTTETFAVVGESETSWNIGFVDGNASFESKQLGDTYSFGFPMYAVGQCADILSFRPELVPPEPVPRGHDGRAFVGTLHGCDAAGPCQTVAVADVGAVTSHLGVTLSATFAFGHEM
jgi:hypothetical protein